MTDTTQSTLPTTTVETTPRRIVSESAPRYTASPPDDLVDASNLQGYVRYSLTTSANGPTLNIDFDPTRDADDIDAACNLTMGGPLQLPRDATEWLAPKSFEWHSPADNHVEATLDLADPGADTARVVTTGRQQVRDRGGNHTLTLPPLDEFAEMPYVDVRLTYRDGEYAVAVQPMMTATATGQPVREPTARPQIDLPSDIAAMLGVDDGDYLPIIVRENGDVISRSDLAEMYGATPAAVEETSHFTYLSLPDDVREQLDDATTTRPLDVVTDRGTPLLLVDTTTEADADDALAATVASDEVTVESALGETLALDTRQVDWQYENGLLIAECISESRVATPPAANTSVPLSTGSAGTYTIRLPDSLHGAAEVSLDWAGDGTPYLTAERATDASGEDADTVSLPPAIATAIDLNLSTAVADWHVRGDERVGRAFLYDEAADAVSDAPSEPPTDSMGRPSEDEFTLDIPDDGYNHRVREHSGGNHVVSVPTEAREQYDLGEGDKLELKVTTFDDHLAISAVPIADEEVSPAVAVGRMLSGSTLKLPLQLVSALSLFDRTITWGFDWPEEGCTLVGLLSPATTPPLSLGEYVGDGVVYAEHQSKTDTNHYYLTIPRDAVDGLQPDGSGETETAGLFVGYEYIEGESRFLLMPVAEDGLDLPGTVKVSDHWNEDFVRVTLPKSLAVATPIDDEDGVGWAVVEGALVGTPT